MLRATFMGFEASKSAIFANQKAIDIVGNNIANSETTGYTKQRVERVSVYTTNYASRTASSTVGLAGQGVEAIGVSQTRDAFLDKCFRDEYSQASYYGQARSMIDDILNVFPEAVDVTSTSGILGALENVYTNLNTFIQSSTLDSEANLVKSAFTNMVQVLQQADERLSTVSKRQKEDLGTTIDRTNEILDRVVYINKVIASDATINSNGNSSYFVPNELADERNLLLDELASYSDISVIPGSDGTVSVEMGDKLVLDKFKTDHLLDTEKQNGCTAVTWLSSGEAARFETGSIKAYINVLNGRGANASNNDETSTQGVPYYRDRINTFAAAFAEVANTSIPEEKDGKPLLDADGEKVYKTLIAAMKSDGTTDSKTNITAKNIAISDMWNKSGSGYFIFSRDENVEDYAQKLSARLSNENYTFASYGESFSGTFNEYMVEMVGRLGTDVGFNEGRSEASAQVADDFLVSRDSVAGVQQDEETTNLMIFQKAFSASSRVMTTMDELLEIIINRMGRVGL